MMRGIMSKPNHMGAPKHRYAILILGMHRSGTSALTRCCNLMGAKLGETLPASEGNNAKGFWEHQKLVDFHNRLLIAIGSGWEDTRFLPDGWVDRREIAPYKEELAAIISEDFGDVPLWAMKDPRLCRLLPLWIPVLEQLGITPVFILASRAPYDVAMSLHKRDGFPFTKSLLLWLQHVLESEAYSRNFARVVVEYSVLLSHPQQTLTKISSALGISWPVPYADVQAEIDDFLSPELQTCHNTTISYSDNEQVKAWVEKVDQGLQHFSASTPEQFTAIKKELQAELAQGGKWFSFWCDDALQRSRTLADAYSMLHVRNLAYLEREAELAAAITERVIAVEKANSYVLSVVDAQSALEDKVAELTNNLDETKSQLQKSQQIIQELTHMKSLLLSSTSWRITAPIRAVKTTAIAIVEVFRFLSRPSTVSRIRALMRSRERRKQWFMRLYHLWQGGGLKEVYLQLLYRPVVSKLAYDSWIEEYDSLSDSERNAIRIHSEQLPHRPLISVIMPVYNIEEKWLVMAIESVLNQLYPYFEFCIADDNSTKPHIKEVLSRYAAKDSRIKLIFREKNGHISECSNSALELASGEFVALMDHDDLIPEDALYYVACAINDHPQADLFYSDEDKLDDTGRRYAPYFKSDWNPDLFYCQNMFSHLGVLRRSLVEKVGGFRKGLEGSQDYDLVLRLLPHTSDDKIIHIPKVLYHWRAIPSSTAHSTDAKNYSLDASRIAIEDYFAVKEPGIKIADNAGIAKQFHRVIWPLPDKQPKVSLIIPTRNGYKLLHKCVESILSRTTYQNYEIIIVNNQSDDLATLAYFDRLKHNDKVTILSYDQPFNFSAINNFAVSHSTGEVLGFINNDIEVITPGWLEEMVSHAIRPEIGAVGAKLYYPDNTVQHGGVVIGVGPQDKPVANHLFLHLHRHEPGYFCRALLTQSLSAVTAACMIMRRNVFEEISGYNENIKVAFNDVDLCMRIRAHGYRIIWTPYAELYHYESATRGLEDTPEKLARFRGEVEMMRLKWGKALDNDPYYNVNLDSRVGDFALAIPPRIEKPWLRPTKRKQVAA